LKRVFDIIASLSILALVWPLVVLAIVAVRIKLGSPILFRQQRPGLHGEPFEMVKLRTMLNAVGADGKPLPDAERLTRFGKFLRSTSLDEFPALWNVLKGEMSLVGPRPLLMEYLPLYNERQSRRHDVKPGVTGWAQVNGRNAIEWKEKFELDVWYVDHYSLLLDIKILFLTVWKVVRRDGISAAGHVSQCKFEGNGPSQLNPEVSD
jgi:lipopolysaccharide/colanic/teichoic acid biosynthesis glycosyltransferase